MPDDDLTKGIGYEESDSDGQASEAKPRGKTYFLFIAIDHYVNEQTEGGETFSNLNNPIFDVNLVMECLMKHYDLPEVTIEELKTIDERYSNTDLKSYTGEYVSCLFNEGATKKNIRNWFKKIAEDKLLGAEDNLLVYFSGHGEYNAALKTFYIIPANGVKDDDEYWLPISDIYNYFNSYQADKICRDFLLILDCCFAGAVEFGHGSNPVEEKFSRYVLTSSGDEETAADGRIGEGSPFARALTKILTNNSTPLLTINGIQNDLNKQLMHNSEDAQSLHFLRLPVVQNGKGHFEFHLKQKDKPRIDQLKETFIEHLDFQTHKGILSNKFSRNKNAINIITTFGSSFNAQKLLSKVLFKWIFKRRLKYTRGHIFHPVPLDLSNPETHNIGKTVYTSILGDHIDSTDYVSAICKYILDTLEASHDKTSGECEHMLIWIGYQIGDENWIKELQDFCVDLKSKYLIALAKLDADTNECIGKLFVVLSDERPQGIENAFDILEQDFNNDYNLLITPEIDPININHFEDWKEEAGKDIKIKIAEIEEQVIFKDGKTETDVNEFITKVCTFCDYSIDERKELYKMLYDFRNQLF